MERKCFGDSLLARNVASPGFGLPVPLPGVRYFLPSMYSWIFWDGWTQSHSQTVHAGCLRSFSQVQAQLCELRAAIPTQSGWEDTVPHFPPGDPGPQWGDKTLLPVTPCSSRRLCSLGPFGCRVPNHVHTQDSCDSRSAHLKAPESRIVGLSARCACWSKEMAFGARISMQKEPRRGSTLCVFTLITALREFSALKWLKLHLVMQLRGNLFEERA